MGNNTISGDSLSTRSSGQWLILNYSGDNSVLTAPADKPKSKLQTPFPDRNKVSVNAKAGEDPRQLHRRILLEAASQAGLDGTDEQKRFVEQFLGGLKYTEKTVDPSPQNDKSVKSSDIKNESLNYELSPQEIAALRQFQKDYRATGGSLRAGKVYDNSSEGRTLTPGEQRSGKRGITAGQYERWQTREAFRQAQILPSVFGTPSRLQDLKRVSISVPADVKTGDAERILSEYIDQRYGGGNILGDKLNEIRDLAKLRGVKLENATVSNGKAEFDISVGDLLKLHHTYIGVQEQVNASEKIADTAREKMALNQFLIGAGEGAWGAVKANYEMVRHPVQTVSHIQEAVTTLANLKQEDLLKIYEALKAEGKAFIFEKDISEVSREMGKAVGAALVEFALGKGIGAGLTALRGLPAATAFLKTANELKQTIGKLPVPTPAMKVVVDTMGNKMVFPDVELTKLEDIVKMMKSSDDSLTMLKNGSTAGTKTIREVAESGLSETAQSGLKALRGTLSKEGLAKAKEQLVTLSVARTELMARLDNLIKSSNLLSDTKEVLASAKNSLKDHLTQDDLVGALRDAFGKPVKRIGDGKVFDHLGEVNDTIASLNKAKDRLTRELRQTIKGSGEYKRISQEIDVIKEMTRRVNTFLELK